MILIAIALATAFIGQTICLVVVVGTYRKRLESARKSRDYWSNAWRETNNELVELKGSRSI